MPPMPPSSMETISDDVVEKFHRDGYTFLENFIPKEEVAALEKACMDFLDAQDPVTLHKTGVSLTSTGPDRGSYQFESGDKMRIFFEVSALDPTTENGLAPNIKRIADGVNKLGHGIHIENPEFKTFTHNPRFREFAKRLGFTDDSRVVNSMFFFKQPRCGRIVHIHREETFLQVQYVRDGEVVDANKVDRSALFGFWVPLHDASPENSCLYVVPGSHLKGVPKRFSRYDATEEDVAAGRSTRVGDPVMKSEGADEELPEEEWIPVPAKVGSCVILDGRILHKSAPNCSEKPRHAYAFQCVDMKHGENEWSPRSWMQMPNDFEFPKL